MAVKITYFVHGTTTDNEKGISSGWFDVGLSELGVKQSVDLKDQIKDRKFDVVFCSDLKRAVDSAKLTFEGEVPIISDTRLRECNYGKYNAQSSSVVEPMQEKMIRDRFPGGESYEDVKVRIADFLDFLRKDYDGKNVAMVGHKAPQLALDVLLKGKTWREAFEKDWRKTKSWKPGWDYEVNETAVNFIDSESCEIDGERMLYFRDPRQLRDKIIETLKKVGAEKFFSSPDEDVKKTREGMSEFFFTLALKMDSGQDWFLMQPQNDPPDFVLMTAKDNPIEITLDEFELVEIPGRCKTFEEMMQIVQNKINKGYPENYHLLIFVNNENSKEWVNLLNQRMENYHPFKTVWTVHLLWYKKSGKDLYGCVANRLRPHPIKHIETPVSDDGLGQAQSTPSFMQEIRKGGKVFLGFKPDFVKELTKAIRKLNLGRLQQNRDSSRD